MKTLPIAGALALAAILTAGAATLPLKDLRSPGAQAPFAVAKIGQPEARIEVTLASSSLPRR